LVAFSLASRALLTVFILLTSWSGSG